MATPLPSDKLTVRRVEAHELDTWDEFVGNSPQGSLFHTSIWKRVIDEAYAPAAVEILGCFDEHGVVGGCVALKRVRFGHRTAVLPLLTPYMGFVLREPGGEKLSDRISQESAVLERLASAMGEEFAYQNFITVPELEDTRPLQTAGYRIAPRFTYYINLSLPADELWQRMDGSVRRQIRKGQEAGFEITDRLDLNQAFALFSQNFVRRGRACPVDRKLFNSICASERLRGQRHIYCAYRGDQLAGFIVFLGFRSMLYYSIASTSEEFLPSGVSSLLIWEAIEEFANQQWTSLDFVGANMASIARFKEGFNPKLMVCFQCERFSRPYLKLGKALRGLISQ